MSEGQEALRAELALMVERIDGLERKQTGALQKLDERQTAALAAATESAATAAADPAAHPLDRRDGRAGACAARRPCVA